jgi:CheY-like chemotaxis protein
VPKEVDELVKKMGDILIEAGIITARTLELALERQKVEKKRLGAILEEMGVITEDELSDCFAKQLNLKTIKKFKNKIFPQRLLDLIPAEFAMRKLVFPLKQEGKMLAVAINDPYDVETTEFLTHRTGCQIIPVISPRREILDAISSHYLGSRASLDTAEQILVVEDSVPATMIIQAALIKEGFTVLIAYDGLEGYKQAISERPRLIITDLVMPRMDGYTLLNSLRSNPMTDHIPVIMLSGKASAEEEQKALDFGFDDFIPKPINVVRIVSRVKRVLRVSGKVGKNW